MVHYKEPCFNVDQNWKRLTLIYDLNHRAGLKDNAKYYESSFGKLSWADQTLWSRQAKFNFDLNFWPWSWGDKNVS